MSVRLLHSAESLKEVLSAIFAAGAILSKDDKVYLREEVERIALQLLSDRSPEEGPETWFNFLISRKEEIARLQSTGGRPRDVALATAMHALANLYVQCLGGELNLSDVPAGQNSHFPRFAAAVLAPVLGEQNGTLVPRIAKYWQRERKKMQEM